MKIVGGSHGWRKKRKEEGRDVGRFDVRIVGSVGVEEEAGS